MVVEAVLVEGPKSRISKRWVFLGSFMILVLARVSLPYIVDETVIKQQFSNLSDYVLEKSLQEFLPDGQFADDIIGNITAMFKSAWQKSEYGDTGSPGTVLRKQGAKAHFPIVIIPGVITTGLELWEGKECARKYFRDRIWGTLSMIKMMLIDRACWIEHMKLDPDTARDPAGIRIRPAQGLEAGDFIMPGYWVWGRIIENLAELGYDHNNMHMASFDWRLDVTGLEGRDHYFTRLKAQIETITRTNGRRAVVVTHSYGASVWHYFMKWVEADVDHHGVTGGKGGPKWVASHIQSIVNIGGTLLGAPKSLSTFTSGETMETAMLGKLESYVLELLLSKPERAPLFRTWIGGLGLIPKGGNLIWGTGRARLRWSDAV